MQLWTKAVRLAAVAALAMVLALTLPPPIETMILRLGYLALSSWNWWKVPPKLRVGCAADGIAGGNFGGVVVGGVEAGALVVDDVGEGKVDGSERVHRAVGDEVLGIEAVFNGVTRVVADDLQTRGGRRGWVRWWRRIGWWSWIGWRRRICRRCRIGRGGSGSGVCAQRRVNDPTVIVSLKRGGAIPCNVDVNDAADGLDVDDGADGACGNGVAAILCQCSTGIDDDCAAGRASFGDVSCA